MRMNIDEFQKFADGIRLGFNDRIKVDVLNAGRVPFINVGPQQGVHLQRFEVEGLITMGYNVNIVEATVKVVLPVPVERIDVNVVIEKPVVEAPVVQEEVKEEEIQPELTEEKLVNETPSEETTNKELVEEDKVAETPTEEELVLQMDHKWLKDTLSVDELKVVLETIGVKFGTKALEDELVKLVLKNQAKVKEHFKVA